MKSEKCMAVLRALGEVNRLRIMRRLGLGMAFYFAKETCLRVRVLLKNDDEHPN